MAWIRPKIVIDACRRAWNNVASLRTGGGAVERAGLENQFTLRGDVGSNPTLSALFLTAAAMLVPPLH